MTPCPLITGRFITSTATGMWPAPSPYRCGYRHRQSALGPGKPVVVPAAAASSLFEEDRPDGAGTLAVQGGRRYICDCR